MRRPAWPADVRPSLVGPGQVDATCRAIREEGTPGHVQARSPGNQVRAFSRKIFRSTSSGRASPRVGRPS